MPGNFGQEDFKKLPAARPAFVSPMKPSLSDELPANPDDWLCEIKFDGIRTIAVKDGANVELYSRNRRKITGEYPEIRDAIAALPAGKAVLDGEVVALTAKGISSFQLLQNRNKGNAPLCCYFVDILNLEGHDTTNLPLERRQEILATLLQNRTDPIRLSESIDADPETFLQQARKLGLEGMIAKKPGTPYRPGKRSRDWLKVKVVHQQEFVIGGFTPPKGSRKHFGSVLVGYYEKKKLIFAGKVGTGFSDRLLKQAAGRFGPLITGESPFESLPADRGRRGAGLTPSDLKKCTWLKPNLVCEVKFSEWTTDGLLRQPVFLGFRDDKAPTAVTREVPA